MRERKTIQKIAARALDEGRLFWCVTDQYGRPCNGGDKTQRIDPPKGQKPGAWSVPVEDPRICSCGYHVTTKPWAWAGSLVWLVEVDAVLATQGNKLLVQRRRALACVDPDHCVDLSIFVAASRPYLEDANLRDANLRDADLRGADLRGANLRDANLRDANLRGADLEGADLRGADLHGADLYGANLEGANVYGANLHGANLYGANLEGANVW